MKYSAHPYERRFGITKGGALNTMQRAIVMADERRLTGDRVDERGQKIKRRTGFFHDARITK